LATLLSDSRQGLVDSDSNSRTDTSPASESLTPHGHGLCFGSPPSGSPAFDVSESFDTSRSLNFELSPIRRLGDAQGAVVGAVPIRPTCDLSGLSDNTSNPAPSEASMDISFGSVCGDRTPPAEADVAQLSEQDGTSGGSDPLPMAYCHMSKLEDTAEEVDATVGDTGSSPSSTLVRTQESLDLRIDFEVQKAELRASMMPDISEQLDSLQGLAKEVNCLSQLHLRKSRSSSKQSAINGLDAELERLSEHRESTSTLNVITFEDNDDCVSEHKALKKDVCAAAPESIPKEYTMLSYLRNRDCCLLLMVVIIPQGLREDRLIRVNHGRKSFEFVVPDGLDVGEQLTVQIPRIPPLDAESKVQIFNQLAHPLKWRESKGPDGNPIYLCDEIRKEMRMQHYQSMKGSNMDPTVSTIDETEVLEDETDQLQPLDLIRLYMEGV